MIESIIVTTVLRGALYALLASGLSLIYGVGRIINLAHTAFYMLAAFTMYYFMMQLKLPPVLTVVITVVVATVVGVLVYRFLIDRIRQHEAAVLIVTVAVAMALQELMRIGFGSLPSGINDLISGTRVIAGVVVYKQQLLTVGVAALVIVALELLLSKTRLGIAVRAVAQDAEVANLMGISVPRTLTITVGIGTGLAGVAAVLMAPREGAIYYMWMAPLMMVLVIIVLGGLGNIKGSIIGAFIIALVEALVYALLPTRSYLYTVFALAVMVVVLSVRPGGLFGIVFEEEKL